MRNVLVAFGLILSQFFPLLAAAKARVELFPDLEKPAFSAPVKDLPDIVIPKGGFAAFLFRLKGTSLSSLTPVQLLKFIPVDESHLKIDLKSYGVAGLNLKRGSAREKAPGFVEDILIPNELLERKSFHIPKENEAPQPTYLVQIEARRESPVGVAKGRFQVQIGREVFDIPVSIRIANEELPKTFSLKTSFGFSTSAVIHKHNGKWDAASVDFVEKYVDLALEHHIDLHKIYLQFPEGKGQSSLLARAKVPGQSYLELWKRWSGASRPHPLVTTDLPVDEKMKSPSTQAGEIKKQTREFWTALNESTKENGLTKTTFVYFADEPTDEAIPKIAKDLKEIRTWAPDLKFLITTPFKKALDGLVQIWVLNLAEFDTPKSLPPLFYQKRTDEFWFYTSCNAHGCQDAENLQVADLVIDRPSAYARVFPWMAVRYGAKGLLYYDTVYGYELKGKEGAPWSDPFAFTGDGEGNLFYPCTRKICGVEAPLPSLRLKLMHLGLQDAEILSEAEKKGRSVQKIIGEVVRSSHSFSTDSGAFRKKIDLLLTQEPSGAD